MANIQQAVKWMQEGKKVRRPMYHPDWKHGLPYPQSHPYFAEFILLSENGIIVGSEGLPVSLLPGGLLAEDWEIAE